ncbi:MULTISPECIES: carbohydrate-binding protein [unclassified Streptomyces]|uniref:carbohydrate-binding protein n=1 Tax=unclassified Streptomyces TaxID=2593676 RepID=UPI002E2A36F8|nr:carbohydrate-binding protein [Streptomyces sp. NBC_01429]
MTAGNNGASKPEDDDPFGYLYEDGQAAAAGQRRQGGYGYPGPAVQPGVPRTSYNQVRAVGERQYGQQQAAPPQQAAYGQQQAYGQSPYGQQAPSAQHSGAAPTQQVPGQRGGGGRGSGGGPNTKGLLIAAVAVVAIVVIGITVALLSKTGDSEKNNDAAPTDGPAPSGDPSQEPSADASDDSGDASGELPKGDAAVMKLTAPAAMSSDIKGAKGTNGAYVSLNGVGASASWTFDAPEAGEYTVFVTYGVPGKDAETTLSINGKSHGGGLNMENFAKAPEGDWEKGWTVTYAWINLEKGSNTIKISCEDGNQCETVLDQFTLKEGHVKR